MTAAFAGLDLDGVLDRAARVAEGGVTLVESPVPACVVASAATGRLLAGPDAASAIEGRGLDPNEKPGLRTGVLALWQAVLGRQAAGSDREARRRLAAHWRWLAGPVRQMALAIPDPLDERSQDRLLEIARSERLELRLLWRPVAAALGAAAGNAWHGRRALVLHLGTAGAEAALLDLEIDEKHGLLVPVRSRRGVAARAWDAQGLASDLARPILAGLGLEGDGWCRRLLLTPLPWSALLGHTAVPEPIRGDDGAWRLATGAARLPAEQAEDIAAWLEALVEPLGKAAARPDLALVEGTVLGAVFDDGTSLARLIRSTLAPLLRLPASHVQLLAPDAVARGCAEYARRRALGLPTYYDFLPQIEINAVRERKVAFVPLVRGQNRIADGEPYEDVVGGFRVPARADKLVFTLTYGDEPHVRTLEVALPAPLEREAGVRLHVTQRPASGSAQVEILTEPPGVLGTGRLLLDWQRLEETEETREEALARLSREIGFAYPECSPIQAHRFWWQQRDLERLFQRFAAEPLPSHRPPSLQRQLARAKKLLDELRSGRLPPDVGPRDGARYGVVDANGLPPEGLGPSARAAYEAMRAALARDFATIRAWARDREVEALERQLYLAGAWCYAGCPEPIVRFFRDELRAGRAGHAIQAIGRAFARDDDIRAFIARAAAVCASTSAPSMNWVKSCAMLLAFREGAARLLDDRSALRLVGTARGMLEEQVAERNVQQRFFNAAYLLLGTLRYRILKPRFLLGGEGDPAPSTLKSRLGSTLDKARRISRGHHRRLVDDVIAFLEGRGTNQLIFDAVDSASEADE